ncbi:hypothetical protein BGZ51_001731, partial [Haplosporangium sp. Z 767]
PKQWIPKINDEFNGLDEAKAWIEAWAADIGFKIRTGKSKLSETPPSSNQDRLHSSGDSYTEQDPRYIQAAQQRAVEALQLSILHQHDQPTHDLSEVAYH